MVNVKRKTLVAREDLARRLNSIAKRRGNSLFNVVNGILEVAIQADELDQNLKRLLEGRRVIKAAKEAGLILGLERLWYEMAELAYSKSRNKALKSWFEAGVWTAKRYVTSETEDPFAIFTREMEAFTWNAPELTIEKIKSEVLVRVISPRFPESYTFLFAAFLEGALNVFGYNVERKELGKGTIRLEALWKEANGEAKT